MITLTEKQQRELKGSGVHVRVLDPTTRAEYVLVRADVFARLQLLVQQAEDEMEHEAWLDGIEEARAEMANE